MPCLDNAKFFRVSFFHASVFLCKHVLSANARKQEDKVKKNSCSKKFGFETYQVNSLASQMIEVRVNDIPFFLALSTSSFYSFC